MNITASNKGFKTISILLLISIFTACGGGGGGGGDGGGGTADTTAPVITLTGDNPQTIEVGTAYTELGATAQDNVDGNISANITTDASAVDTSTIGSYNVTYNVSDVAGNAAATQTRTVNVVAVADTIAPVITLTGDNPQTIFVGTAYTELGATAQDNLDGDISANIIIDASAVDTSTIGSYSATYNVSDAASNAAATQTRTVDVIAAISNNADLSNLSLSVGSLTPAFDAATMAYTSDVDFTTTSITVTPTLSDINASVTVNGTLVSSGTASDVINLDEGENSISLVVLAEDSTSTQTYTVTVTRQAATDFAQLAYFKASNTGAAGGSNWFGYSVALAGDTLVVGSRNEASNATGVDGDQNDNTNQGSGAVYVFIRSGGTWTQQAYIKASNTDSNDNFGGSVALAGDTLAVGSRNEASNATGIDGDQDDNSLVNAGAVYVFTRTGSTWSQQAYIKASNTGTQDRFGQSVALEGDTLAVGAMHEFSSATGIGGDQDDNTTSSAGAVYMFTRNAGTWSQQAYIKASNTRVSYRFGYSVALEGDTLAVGSYGESSNATGVDGDQSFNGLGINSGAVYVFTHSAGTWTQQSYIKASNTDGSWERFGSRVALDGDTLAVGAIHESSSSTGIGGDESNNDAPRAGAVYVFVRNAGSWAQQAYIKASNTDVEDRFGASIALNGDTLAVGATQDDSNATGIGGDDINNDAINSGAVYVFTRSGSTWAQQAYIKASNTDASDFFGASLTLDDDRLIVGASRESSNATGVDGDQGSNHQFQSGAVYLFDIPAIP